MPSTVPVIAGLLLLLPVLPTIGASQDWPELRFSASAEVLDLPPGWNLAEVPAVALNAEGHVFVFHRGDRQLLEFDSQGSFVREIGAGLFENPHGLRIDREGNIWTADLGTHVVLKFDQAGRVGMVLGKHGTAGEGWFDRDYNLPLFNQPHDVAFDRMGNIYVVDRGNHRIVKFGADGRLMATWGREGAAPGEFNFPHAIVIDHADRVYVGDRENRRIQVFDTSGAFLEEWTDIGYPYGMALARDAIWITDARAERIVKLDRHGQVLGAFGRSGKGVGEFGFVHGIAVAPSGQIYVSEILNWRLQLLEPTERP